MLRFPDYTFLSPNLYSLTVFCLRDFNNQKGSILIGTIQKQSNLELRSTAQYDSKKITQIMEFSGKIEDRKSYLEHLKGSWKAERFTEEK